MPKIKSIFLIIFLALYGAVRFQLHLSCGDCENACVRFLIVIIKPEVGLISYYLGLGHETMVSDVCLAMFLLITIFK